jgi:tetratricopeptide (TPR) repeat protein
MAARQEANLATERSERVFVVALFLFALSVRLLFLWQASATPLFWAPGVDESWHHRWANELLDNHWQYDQVYFRAPLYPYFLAGLYAVSGRSIVFARTAQMFLSAISVVLLYLIGRRCFPRPVARAAATFMCIYGTLIWYEHALLIAVLSIVLDLLLLYLVYRYKESSRLVTVAVAGLVGGLSLIARPNLAVFLCAVGVWLFLRLRHETPLRHRAIRAGVFLVCAGLPVLPVAYHNYSVSGDLIAIANQGGVNFYIGNNPVANGLTMQIPEVRLDESIPWDEFVPTTDSIASSLAGRKLSPGEVSAFWSNRMVDYTLSHPGDFLIGLGRKTYFFFAGVENSDNFDLYYYRKLVPVYAAFVWRWGLHFPFGLISPLAILGLVWSWRRRGELDLLYIFILTYAPTVIGVLVTARHRLPVSVVFLLFAAAGAFELYRRLRSGPRARRIVSAAWATALLVLLNTELFGIGFENPRQSHVNMGLAYQKLNDTTSAEREFAAALAIDSNSVLALNNLGVTYLDRGDLYQARRLFERALRVSPSDRDIQNNLAAVMSRQGQFEEAAGIFWRLARENPSFAEPFFSLARIAADRQQYDTALAFYDSALSRRPNYPEALTNKGWIYAQLGDGAHARESWRRAIELRPDYLAAGRNLVQSWLEAGYPDSARGVLEQARGAWRNSADWYYLSAETHRRQGQADSAKGDLQRALRIDPKHPAANRLARGLGGSD